MAERSAIDQLDDVVAAIIAQREADLTSLDPDVASLAQVARELRGLPTEEFKTQLKTELTRRETMSTPKKKIDPIPKGHPRISAYMCFSDAPAAIEFYKKAFGAEEIKRLPGPDGKSLIHAELKIGNSRLLLVDEFPEMDCRGPKSVGGSPVSIHMFVDDADAAFDKALAAGAEVRMPLADQFWGDRYGVLTDPFGHIWSIATHKENLTPQEIGERAQAAFSESVA